MYVRHGASSVPASESAILKMIRETDGEKYEELRSLNQSLTFRAAHDEFAVCGLPFAESQMKSLKIMNTGGVFTNLGLLLSDQCVHTIKSAVFEGERMEIFRDRREFSGSLLRQINDAFAFVDLHNGTSASFEGLHRTDRRDYPAEAVREALMNAATHREYAFGGSTLVNIFQNRVEFISIGGLVKGISLGDIMLGVSIARNENLANVLYRLKLIESYGTGIQKILRAYGDASVKPKIEVSDNAFKITLPNVNSSSGGTPEKSAMSKKESEALSLLAAGPVSRSDVQKALAISQSMAGRLLRGLVEKGAVSATGGGKNTMYVGGAS
ncbi:MAG: hypothetical protein LBU26_01125 [Synergistaceae bacterium]|jgi:ATP-dependent DNA helicase RecG|nr:hypothetical protein [Synergistaceae bacterium]